MSSKEKASAAALTLDKEYRIKFDGKLNFEFSNYSNCFPINSIDYLKDDCLKAYNRSNEADDDNSSISSSDYHNSGSTCFQRSDMKPRCCLEELALAIFHLHTKDAIYNPETSGAEWWTQVIPAQDDIG
jgi:hypothetical protein